MLGRDRPGARRRGRAVLVSALVATLALAGCSDDANDFDIAEATVADVQAALASGGFRCRDVVQRSLDRIAATDDAGPSVNALLVVNADALAVADEIDAATAAGVAPGPLHCVPLIVKDNFGTGDDLRTTAGSLTMGDFVAPEDAFVVARLRAAGAVFVAKSNMDEWAFGVSGYSSRGGQTRNSYKLDRIPGGSSGGSAAAVAAGMAVLATGSDTAGSIRIPGSFNGLVGIKPTLGLLGRSGIIPASENLDVPGPLARTVTDAAIMLGVMTGVDPGDPASASCAACGPTDYRPSLDVEGLRGARIAVLREALGTQLGGQNADVDASLERSLATLAARGATLSDPVAISADIADDELVDVIVVLGSEVFPGNLNTYLATDGAAAPIRDFSDLVDASRALGPDVVRNLSTFEQIAAAPPPTPDEVAAARRTQAELTSAIVAALDEAGADALVFPTLLCPATPIGGVVDPGYECASAPPMPFDFGVSYGGDPIVMASIAGLPEITVPAGFTKDGLPIGISFLGRPFSEATLIRLAYAFEQATLVRRPPRFLPGPGAS
jgi:amidase